MKRARWRHGFWILAAVGGAVVRWAFEPSVSERFAEAQKLLAAGKDREAEWALRKVLWQRPTHVPARVLLARMGVQQRRWATVAAALQTIPADYTTAPELLVIEGDAWLRLGYTTRAERAWTQATRLNPDLIEAKHRLLFLYGVQLRRRPWRQVLWDLYDRDRVHMREMIQLMIAGHVVWETEEAIRIVRSFLAQEPDDWHSRLALGIYLCQAGRTTEAVTELERLVQRRPGDLDAVLALVQCHLAAGKAAEAERLLRRLPADERDPRLLKARAAVELLKQRYAQAAKLFQASLRTNPYDMQAQNKLARALALTGQNQQARQHAEVAHLLARIERMCHTLHTGAEPSVHRILRLADWCRRLRLTEEALGWVRVGLQLHPEQPALLAARDKLLRLPRTSTRHPPPENGL